LRKIDVTTLSFEDTLKIEHACTRLALDYSHYADSRQMDAWAGLFAEDAEMLLMGQHHKGRAAIRASVNGNPPDTASVHKLHNIRIDVVSPTEATGTVGVSLFVAPRKDGVGQAKDIAPVIIGNYQDVYRKTAEGWRFASRAFAPVIIKQQG
jgi:hypothetical protein